MIDKQKLAQAAGYAIECERQTKLPAKLTLAQWALESGWGEHQPGNNCFGIKAMTGRPEQQLGTVEYIHGTRENVTQPFAVFDTLGDCFNVHAILITCGKRYSGPWDDYEENGDIEMLVKAISPIYSTSPTYATQILNLMQSAEIQSAYNAAVANADKIEA